MRILNLSTGSYSFMLPTSQELVLNPLEISKDVVLSEALVALIMRTEDHQNAFRIALDPAELPMMDRVQFLPQMLVTHQDLTEIRDKAIKGEYPAKMDILGNVIESPKVPEPKKDGKNK